MQAIASGGMSPRRLLMTATIVLSGWVTGGAAQELQHARVRDERQVAPSQGQTWRTYDLRPYFDRVRGLDDPAQPVMDWVIRETGTDRWFGSVAGMLTEEPDGIRVFHVAAVHDVVAQVVDRYVNPALIDQGVSARLVTVESINWRSVALPTMERVPVHTPGLEAWLLTREDAAMLMAHLRSRIDVREHTSSNAQITHGQSHTIERWQPRVYPQSVVETPTRFPGHQLQMGQLQEGYSLKISPLADSDQRHMEAVVQVKIDQVEQMASLWVDVPPVPGQPKRVELQVPQVASWRIQERFRWPTNRVLLVSRGVIGMPGMKPQTRGLSLLPNAAARAEALLLLECRQGSGPRPGIETGSPRVSRLNYHNRY